MQSTQLVEFKSCSLSQFYQPEGFKPRPCPEARLQLILRMIESMAGTYGGKIQHSWRVQSWAWQGCWIAAGQCRRLPCYFEASTPPHAHAHCPASKLGLVLLLMGNVNLLLPTGCFAFSVWHVHTDPVNLQFFRQEQEYFLPASAPAPGPRTAPAFGIHPVVLVDNETFSQSSPLSIHKAFSVVLQ